GKLKSGTPKEKAKAAKDLGDRGAIRATDVKDAIELLKGLLVNDSNPSVRAAAAEALGKIAPEPTKETVQLLLKALKEDKEDEVRMATIIALGRMGTDAKVAIPELQKIAKD